MSHATGKVYSLDGKLLAHFEYNGTADVSISCLHSGPNGEGAWQDCQWREHTWRHCTCGQKPIEVLLWSCYGHDSYWLGKVCLACRAIVEETQYCEKMHVHANLCPPWRGTPGCMHIWTDRKTTSPVQKGWRPVQCSECAAIAIQREADGKIDIHQHPGLEKQTI